MGSFDSVYLDVPLPSGECSREVFQAKDLGCDFDLYVITREKKLLVWRFADNHEDIPKEFFNHPIEFIKKYNRCSYKEDTEDGAKEHNSCVHVSRSFHFCMFTGGINFYGKNGEFVAIFAEGSLMYLGKSGICYLPIEV